LLHHRFPLSGEVGDHDAEGVPFVVGVDVAGVVLHALHATALDERLAFQGGAFHETRHGAVPAGCG